ncbi:MAG: hypothetical protein AAF939_21780 [Planctomycetota bacterium]
MIRLDILLKQKDDILAFKKFPNLERIYVAQLDEEVELEQVEKALPDKIQDMAYQAHLFRVMT